MRILPFAPTSPTEKAYELVYQSLLFSPLPVQGNERKVHGEVLGKLEAIGELKPMLDADGKTPREYGRDEIRLYHCPAGGSVTLTEAEYDLVKRHVAAIADAPTFPKASSRAIDALIDTLDKLPKVEPEATAAA
jgi:hypothetical protein